MLGNLLRSNQFPEWLEAAALDTLVADASVRLAELSNGQFELTHRNGEFFVIDHADADSQRGVRTLSGGETFQASLALALALSTQLSSMAAAGAARLDSIFLDEGFGTLDESTLEIVAATLESLAQGDRMVGVVTHVAALAERVPVRFVVNRDSRTSSIVPGDGMTTGPADVQAGRSPAGPRRPGMSFSVDGWDPTYGTSLELEEDLGESSAEVDVGIEVPPDRWRPISAAPAVAPPCPVLFVDGVRRIEARVWIDDVSNGSPATDASAAICASYAAGVVCCCDAGRALPRRGDPARAVHRRAARRGHRHVRRDLCGELRQAGSENAAVRDTFQRPAGAAGRHRTARRGGSARAN